HSILERDLRDVLQALLGFLWGMRRGPQLEIGDVRAGPDAGQGGMVFRKLGGADRQRVSVAPAAGAASHANRRRHAFRKRPLSTAGRPADRSGMRWGWTWLTSRSPQSTSMSVRAEPRRSAGGCSSRLATEAETPHGFTRREQSRPFRG